MPNPFQGARYHSLIVDEPALPAELEVVARTPEGTIMALVHRRWPTVGVQFHPESVLTQGGYQLLANFLRLAGLSPGDSLPQLESPEQAEVAATLPPHYHPLTF
jgi:para-aminobenzoate synthetase component 2